MTPGAIGDELAELRRLLDQARRVRKGSARWWGAVMLCVFSAAHVGALLAIAWLRIFGVL